jgi:hypothetical protein
MGEINCTTTAPKLEIGKKKDPRYSLSWVFTAKTSVYRLLAEDLNLEPSG